jgi:hypothetical protein
MTPFPPPMPTKYSRRRNKTRLMEEMKQLHEQHEQATLERQFQLEETLRKMRNMNVPDEIVEMIEMQLQMMAPQLPQPPDLERLKSYELEQLADRFTSSFVEKTASGLKLWDFKVLLASAGRIEYTPNPDNLSDVTLFRDDGSLMVSLMGASATAFMRYLHYLGIFELEAAKTPCPDCGDKAPQDCETCGGLGWVL